ncbi:hypothetical protein CONPUDRAFT_78073 [Coniophora puteana RWD-64-598 SS2]|uniref:DUF6533 domain-containing protein n=1 Tax=Coniophora puteana (strain RWD-64-598) TaxID=741705 RepID=R7SF96_CONPW|nr:uncharacterized protein CONPUDRAFT_78073 [Coniophora puteana RWD-64-598 SS2]EIW74422.1 hypothetical protein CONPUDRAFT_78073 [Coniophora puteana RWD-64-598 SS2]
MSSIDNVAYEEEFLLKFVTRLSAYVTQAQYNVVELTASQLLAEQFWYEKPRRPDAHTNFTPLLFKTHDTLTNLDFEVKYIWKAKLSVIKVLYLLTRYMAYINVVLALWYFTFGHNLTPRMCENAATAVYLMVATRTWAIWGRNRKIAVGMVCLYLGCVAGGVYTIYMFFQSAIITSNPGLPGCFVEGSSLMMKLSWTTMLIGNSALVVLLLIESYLVYKETRSFPALFKTVITDGDFRQPCRTPLLTVATRRLVFCAIVHLQHWVLEQQLTIFTVLVILVIVPIPSGFDFNMTAILSVVADPESSYESSTLPVSTFRVAHHNGSNTNA